MLLSNGAVLQATLLTNTTGSSEFREGFAMIISAKVLASPAQPQGDPTKPFVFHAPTLPGTVRIPAGFTNTPNSAVQSPNYFMVTRDDATTISGWIDEASAYNGFAGFWKREKQAMVDHHMPPEKERVSKIGDWDAVTYLVDVGDGFKVKNVRACRIVGKVWVDAHVSISRRDATWKELEKVLQSVAVEAD